MPSLLVAFLWFVGDEVHKTDRKKKLRRYADDYCLQIAQVERVMQVSNGCFPRPQFDSLLNDHKLKNNGKFVISTWREDVKTHLSAMETGFV